MSSLKQLGGIRRHIMPQHEQSATAEGQKCHNDRGGKYQAVLHYSHWCSVQNKQPSHSTSSNQQQVATTSGGCYKTREILSGALVKKIRVKSTHPLFLKAVEGQLGWQV